MPQARTHSEPICSKSAGLLRGAVGCRAVRCRREGLLLHENWHTSDDETLNEPCAQKPLNRDSTVDVQVVRATSSELRHDLSRRPGHLFNNAPDDPRQIDGPPTPDHYAFVTIGP